MCINKLNAILLSIPEIHTYHINVFSKEILINYTKNLNKILRKINEKGFDTQSINFKHYFVTMFLLVLLNISHDFLYFKLFIMLILQWNSLKRKNMVFYRIFSLLLYILYFLKFDDRFIGNSSSILIYIIINTFITDKLNILAKFNTFKVLEKTNFKKIVTNFDQQIKNFKFIDLDHNNKHINTKVRFNDLKRDRSIVYYQNVESIARDNILYLKRNDHIYVTGIIIYGACLIDNSSNTGEDTLYSFKLKDLVYEGMIVKKGEIVVKVTNITKFDCLPKKLRKSLYNTIIIFTNIIFVLNAFFTFDNLPDILEYIVKLNMKICPCVLLISDVILKLRMYKELKEKQVRINNYDIVKNVKCIFLDKTGTLSKVSKIINYKICPELEGVIYILEKEFTNSYSRSILNVVRKLECVGHITDKEYVSSCGIRCKLDDEEIRIGKFNFCNYLNLKYKMCLKNTIYVSRNSIICGWFFVEDLMIKNAKNVVRILQNNYRVIIVSGDEKRNVEEFCQKVGISEYFYNLKAEDKMNILNAYKNNCCMVGDGINDIPAFNASTVSISLNNNLNADVNIYNIKDLIFVLNLIRKSNRKKVTNYIIAVLYNLVIIFLNIGFIECSLAMYLPNFLIIVNSIYL